MPAEDVFICEYVRTPIGRYGGALAKVRTDDLAAVPIRELLRRHPGIAEAVDEVFYGCANQAGEDNRNVARMAALLAGLPERTPAATINRLCASGLDAVGAAARAIKAGEIELAIAGGVESMTRAPFVTGKSEAAFQRTTETYDTTIGWRFINPVLKAQYGVDAMPETGENVAQEFQVTREAQDAFALRSQERAARAQADGTFASRIVPIEIPDRKGPVRVDRDEHPRADTTLRHPRSAEADRTPGRDGHGRQRLRRQRRRRRPDPRLGEGGGAARADAARARPRPRLGRRAAADHGHRPGAGGRQARRAARRQGLGVFDVIELNEAFASQALACLRQLGVADDAEHVNPNGGAIALGHPLGMSGARIAGDVALELSRRGGKLGLATMCVGVGQGVALAIERV